MADPTADDETRDDAASDDAAEADASPDEAESASPEGDAEADEAPVRAKPTRKRPDPRADVAARRAATKARMDADAEGGGGSTDLAKKATATADDPTGAKARRAAKTGEKKGPAAKASADDPTGTKARREAAANAKKVARPSKRTGGAVDAKAARTTAARSGNPKKAAEASESTRYTAPIPRSQLESPVWVPAIMFTLLGLGGIVILLTYVLWGGRPLTLGIGLALILGGILTATQYR